MNPGAGAAGRSPLRPSALFVAEERRRRMTRSEVAALHAAIVTVSMRMSAAGEPIIYLRGFYLPEPQGWFAVFAADSPQIVQRLLGIIQLSNVQVRPAVEFLPPEGVSLSTAPGRLAEGCGHPGCGSGPSS
ncbi:hypothetical protein ACFYU5_25560 [Nocardia aobensis]|uniref:SseB protein N-terminal domain-containing protein n=1 Tax=Nocardia aobensis TaxID=257277 RepID=A0ABW6P9G3_9NOCA